MLKCLKRFYLKKYKCDFCDKQFKTLKLCNEPEIDAHKCSHCEHGYYVYGCEFECEMLKYDNECIFKPNRKFILDKLRKLYQERDEYVEQSDNDRTVGLLPWGCEIAIIQIENEIKTLESLLIK